MFNDLNNVKTQLDKEYPSLKVKEIAKNGSFGCRRPVGSSYFDKGVNKTFLVWSGPEMDVHVNVYNHSTKMFEEENKVYKNGMSGRWDYHNYPSMIKAPNGKTLIFYTTHTKGMYQLTAPNAHSISGEWSRKTISVDKNCYPAPVVVGDYIYVFYSKNDEPTYPYRTLCYIKSKDNGESWSDPKVIIDSLKQDPLRVDEVYLCGSKYAPEMGKYPERIQLSWSMWGGHNGHASASNSAYFAYFSVEDDKMYSSAGDIIGEVINYKDMVEKCKIEKIDFNEEITKTIASVVSSYRSSNGEPVVVYGSRNPHIDEKAEIKCAQWTGESWDIQTIENESFGIKDIYKDPVDGNIRIVYCKGCYVIISKLVEGEKHWEVESATKIPFQNKAESIPYVNFVDDNDQELQIILGQIEFPEIKEWYTGIWPVLALGKS